MGAKARLFFRRFRGVSHVPGTLPKHGSWLNMAECEFAVLTEQCLDRRIPHITTLCQEITAWQAARNAKQTRINWRFNTTDARITLKRLYPSASSEARLPKKGRR